MSLISDRIKQARVRKGLSLRDLQDRVGVSATALSKYERGLMKPGSDVLLRLAKALDVNVGYFFRPAIVKEIEPAYRKTSDWHETDAVSRGRDPRLVGAVSPGRERRSGTDEIV